MQTVPYLNDFPGYAQIVNCIEQFYPKGLHPTDKGYHKYGGMIERGKLIGQGLHEAAGRVRWESLLDALRHLGLQVRDTGYRQEPAYQGEILLLEYQAQHIRNCLVLYFSVSVLGPYFTVFGAELVSIKRTKNHPGRCNGEQSPPLVVYPSPNEWIGIAYEQVREKILTFFPNYSQIPFKILQYQVNEIYPLRAGENNFSTVYQCLFDGFFQRYLILEGDEWYPIKPWNDLASGTKF